ncbi:siderophore synthetase component [Brevibacterium sanguinis]|uniref:Lysine N-acyltransferase MbtK n=2 Tax=Brevibacterium TaxID=1696 RepID=A0A366IMR6_9MICO|nr:MULTISPECIES: GNAT family N-acetyltransferase [Brevibacterium]RBP68215.1 siderophore synthetase component [Brevibacterium sanguinis]RBP74368.1 siderophore synthetase component [Brevibacterium celere]
MSQTIDTDAPRPGTLSGIDALSAEVRIAPLDPARDAELIHSWLKDERSRYWQMMELSGAEVRDYLDGIRRSPDDNGWVGTVNGERCFYVETYAPSTLIPAGIIDDRPGDIGMHLLVAPPRGERLRGLTDRIMAEVIDFCLRPHRRGGRGATRVIVEPDVRNTAILAKNAAAGFRTVREAGILQDGVPKQALVSVCTREDFDSSALAPLVAGRGEGAESVHSHLSADTFAVVQRHLVTKALSEFSHERLIRPRRLEAQHPGEADDPEAGTPEAGMPEEHVPAGTYVLRIPDSGVRYVFRATVLPLEHWVIDESSVRRFRDGSARSGAGDDTDHELPLDAQELILELRADLGLPDELLSTYLEELASTMAGAAFKLHEAGTGRRPTSTELLAADFQRTEATMTEGHPGFVANNGRIGFGLSDYRTWAPEAGRRNRLEWIAAGREHTHLSLGAGLDETEHLERALSAAERELFESRIRAAGRNPDDFHLLPIHPWQADHRLAITFVADIARGDLLPLGPGLDDHQAQQSLRTFFNHSRTGAPYVKVALAVQNMGFLRGLSPEYMRATPAINDWVAGLVGSDPAFAAAGFRLLREHSAIGYTGDVYHRTPTSNPHRKMIAALWRENPLPMIGRNQRLITMAALLHRDHRGVSYTSELIRASARAPHDWVRDYLRAYLHPLVHGLLAHDLVFMPHGENLILVLEEHSVTGAFMKDIGEEVAVLGPRKLPAEVERIRSLVSGEEKALSVFTDMFDGVLRHLAGILDGDGVMAARTFWRLVAEILDEYESAHPESARGLAGDVDLRAETFAHSCLNRLQLRNTLEMVDISNQAESLLYAGQMANPVAR